MPKNALQVLGYKYEIVYPPNSPHADHGFSLSFDLFDRPNPDQSLMDISKAQCYCLNDFGDPEKSMRSLGYLLQRKYANVLSNVFIIASGDDRGHSAQNVTHLRISPAGLMIGVFDVVLADKDRAKKVAKINLLVDC